MLWKFTWPKESFHDRTEVTFFGRHQMKTVAKGTHENTSYEDSGLYKNLSFLYHTLKAEIVTGRKGCRKKMLPEKWRNFHNFFFLQQYLPSIYFFFFQQKRLFWTYLINFIRFWHKTSQHEMYVTFSSKFLENISQLVLPATISAFKVVIKANFNIVFWTNTTSTVV